MQIHVWGNVSIHALLHAPDMGRAIRHVQILTPQAFVKRDILVIMPVFAAILAIKNVQTSTGVIVMPQDQLAAPQTHVLLIA
jgi:hypothetical protein